LKASGDSGRIEPVQRIFLALAGLNGFLAVALGAFGAHGLRQRLAALSDGVERLDWWRTAATYHLAHALALGLVAVLAARAESVALSVAGWAFLVGMALFSGSLYAMVLTGVRGLGAVTPLGGLAFLVGWAAVVWAAFRGQ
jgi:uncharacterized membrane protein YgdD (TMEM256/DUF423 family)